MSKMTENAIKDLYKNEIESIKKRNKTPANRINLSKAC